MIRQLIYSVRLPHGATTWENFVAACWKKYLGKYVPIPVVAFVAVSFVAAIFWLLVVPSIWDTSTPPVFHIGPDKGYRKISLVNSHSEFMGRCGGGGQMARHLFFWEIRCLTLCGCLRQKECAKLCKLTLKITFFLHFWWSLSPLDTPVPTDVEAKFCFCQFLIGVPPLF